MPVGIIVTLLFDQALFVMLVIVVVPEMYTLGPLGNEIVAIDAMVGEMLSKPRLPLISAVSFAGV